MALGLALAIVSVVRFFQPVILLLLFCNLFPISLSQSLLGVPGNSAMADPVTNLVIIIAIICGPLAYPVFDRAGNPSDIGPRWFVLPPIAASIFACVAYLAGAEPWLTLGLPVAAFIWQMSYGLWLDKPGQSPIDDKETAVPRSMPS